MSFKITPIQGFDLMPVGEATSVIYDRLIVLCEANGVYLSEYGNHAGMYSTRGNYYADKAAQKLFDVQKVQKVYAEVIKLVQPARRVTLSTSELVSSLESKYSNVSSGDVIAAMLLHGFTARFGIVPTEKGIKRGLKAKPLKIRAEFNATLIKDTSSQVE